MKAILSLFLSALLVCSVTAADIKLAWDDAQPGVTYRIEIAPAATPTAWAVAKDKIPRRTVIPNDPMPADYQETVVTGLTPGIYLIRVSAWFNGVDSLPSNVITEPVSPNAPGGLRKVKITMQSSRNMTDWKAIAAVTEDAEQSKFYRTVLEIME